MARRRQQFNGALSTPDDGAGATTISSSSSSGGGKTGGAAAGGGAGGGKGRPPHMLPPTAPPLTSQPTKSTSDSTANPNSSSLEPALQTLHLHGNVKSSVESVITDDPLRGVPTGQQRGQQGGQGRGKGKGSVSTKAGPVAGGHGAGTPGQAQNPTPVAQVLIPKPGVQRDVYDPSSPSSTPVPLLPNPGEATHDDPQAEQEVEGEVEEEDDENTCFICAEPIKYWATGVCGHSTCQ